MKIAVVTDGGSELTKAQAEAQGLYYLPLLVIDGDTTYHDGVDITNEEVFELLRQEKVLKTAYAPVGEITTLFQQLKDEGYEHIIGVPLSAGISSELQAWNVTAQQVGIPITTIDTYCPTGIQRYIAQSAKRLIDEGLELDEIVARLKESVDHSDTYLVVDDLSTLKRGGRLTPAAATLAGMLKIKPILRLHKSTEGKIDTFAKVRTMSKAIQTAVDSLEASGEIDENYILGVVDTIAPEYGPIAKEEYFSKHPDNDRHEGYLAPVIAAHTGLGAVGIYYIKKV